MAEVIVTDPITGGKKGSKEEKYSLIPTYPLSLLAKLYGQGADKYGEYNWNRGYKWSLSYDALMRHLNAFWNGEDIDEETGVPHVINAVFHCFALAQFMQTHPEGDNRPPRVETVND